MNSAYVFLESRSGDIVPGNPAPLHSLVDPSKEAMRLISTIPQDTGFVIFLGLGGGFYPKAALANTLAKILVIDFDKDGIAQLFSRGDYSELQKNKRFTLLVDVSEDEIKKHIIENYNPVLHGGIKVIPLRTRVEQSAQRFEKATAAVQSAIENVASDFSVQAHFGKRWFSNIIRNIKAAETLPLSLAVQDSSIHKAAIVAAGPSLDDQLPSLAEYKLRKVFIICSDTALPVLLHHGIVPDIIVSIDCQHISYYHFLSCNMHCKPLDIPLVLDIASPPLLCGFSSSPYFFSSGHPLALYISRYWRPLPLLDTSGGNVTYACLSLAEYLGIKHITFFGADFSYIGSRTYARGTYIYPFFEKKQNRLSPMVALSSRFLYRSPFLLPESQNQKYYETASLRSYRKKLEEKAAASPAQICAAQGHGAPIDLANKLPYNAGNTAHTVHVVEKSKKTCEEFLEQYRSDIAALPLNNFNAKEQEVFTTLLPLAAMFKHRSPSLKTQELLEETKRFCVTEINKLL